jgi:hypothetical protein
LLIAQPLSASLQDRLRFLRPPLPAVPSPSLAVRIPRAVGHNGLTQLTAVELRASPVGARLPVGHRMSLPARLSGSPPHAPFGHGLQPLGPFLTHERGSPFTCVQPSGASLGRFCLEAGRLRPLSPELRTPPLPETHVWVGTPGHHKVYIVRVNCIHAHE